MNNHELNIMKCAFLEGSINQRALSRSSGYSLGKVNQAVKAMAEAGYLVLDAKEEYVFSDSGKDYVKKHSPERAVILAAGFGLRMSPMNREIPKAFIEINKVPLIERLIEQLHEAGVHEIYIVVGYMKEAFDYLIDKYGVELIVNREYKEKNNLFSLAKAKDHLNNCYILSCDLYAEENLFSPVEVSSWYLIDEEMEVESPAHINRRGEITIQFDDEPGNVMRDIAYVTGDEAIHLQERIEELTGSSSKEGSVTSGGEITSHGPNDDAFWERAAVIDGKMFLPARMIEPGKIFGINTYEQLRSLDSESDQLQSDIILLLANELRCLPEEITDIELSKKGMTNRSFVFQCWDKKYVMRIPGEGTGQLINRAEEYEVYQKIRDLDLCDPVHYINPHNGYKLSEFISGVRCCDPYKERDVRKCLERLHGFHKLHLEVGHTFDLFEKIAYYEELRGDVPPSYRDYELVRDRIYSLKAFIDSVPKEWCLTHIDAVYDNFLFKDDKIYLIDWEYSGMQDPHVDLAMFIIYAFYNREQADHFIDLYFEVGNDGTCTRQTRYKIYAYIAVCGLIWSNWCEYKKTLGVEFGEYSMKQYRYAKDYYKIVQNEYLNDETK